MGEVFGAVIATALVLIAVFVPVSFFPGTTGRLYAQFSLTIAFSVALSAFNALTLTPALSALLLKGGAAHGKGAFFRRVEALIAAGTRGYVATVGRLMRVRWAVVGSFVAVLALTAWVYVKVPRAFVPEQDLGYIITLVQAPAGASLDYTSGIARQVEAILIKTPEVLGVFSVMGFSFSGAAPNQGMIFSALKPFDERKGDEHSAQAIITRLRGPLFGIPGPSSCRWRRRRSGTRAVRRVPVRAARSERRPDRGHGCRRPRDDRRGQSDTDAARPVQHVHGQRPAAAGGSRS